MDAGTIADVIAVYLNDRDDVASAVKAEDGTVEVRTQAGEQYAVAVYEP